MMLKNRSGLSSSLALAKVGANAADAFDDSSDAAGAAGTGDEAADAADVASAGDTDDAEKQIRPVILSCLGKCWCYC